MDRQLQAGTHSLLLLHAHCGDVGLQMHYPTHQQHVNLLALHVVCCSCLPPLPSGVAAACISNSKRGRLTNVHAWCVCMHASLFLYNNNPLHMISGALYCLHPTQLLPYGF